MKNIKNKTDFRRALTFILCAVTVLSLSVGLFAIQSSAAGAVYKYEGLKLIPGGVPFGVKFSTEGVVVVGFCDVDGISKSQNPAYAAGLRPKDVITKINGLEISDAAELTRSVEGCRGKDISLTYRRDGAEKTISLTPLYSKSEGKYKTGIWVRDSGAGIGTVTYIFPQSAEFAGLGHGICDGETGELIPINRGVVLDVTVSGIKKGVSGAPGEIKGYFGSVKKGTLVKNTDCGVYGLFSELPEGIGEAIDVGNRRDVRCGEAEIFCTLDDGQRHSYKIEIDNINLNAEGSKCFIIKITDPALIEKTGGIVQGMSGSPIIQNGKLVGAVTHVMINDPTVGYGIFIENMLNASATPIQPRLAA